MRSRDLRAFLPYLVYAYHVAPQATTDGGECYVATHPDLPGCMAHGASIREAIDRLRGARVLYLEELYDRGLDIPLPLTTASVTWTAAPILPAVTK